MSGSLLPNAKQQFLDANGASLAGGKVYYYIPSTTTFKNTYQDSALTILNTNPIVLDSAGECIAYGSGAYRQQVFDVNNNLIWDQVTYGILPINASTVVYTPPFTNGVATNVQDKLAQYVSVKDFGAIGDGTTNDATAIQNAFNSGKSVYFPVGTYLTGTTTLTLPQNVKVYGDGSSSVILGSGNTIILSLIGTSGTHKTNLTLSNLTIRRTGGVTGSPTVQPVTFTFADNCIVENIVFDGGSSTYPGLFIALGASNLTLRGCTFINGMSCAITSSDATSTGTYSLNTIIDTCIVINPLQGFDIYYTTNTIFNSCIASGASSTYGCGFVIEYQNSGVTLNNCVSYGNVRSGFYFEPNISNGLADISINNCIGYSNGEAGIYMQNMNGVIINGGSYYNNTGTFGSNNGIGMIIYTSSDFTINSVLCNGNTKDGINLNGPYIGCVSNCQLLNNGGYGINFTGAAESLINVIGNNFRNNTSGSVNGWVETNGYWDLGSWVTYTPTIYQNDGTTNIIPSSISVKYKRIGSSVRIIGSFNITGGLINGVTYITVPYNVAWSGSSTGNDALSQLGSCHGNSSGMGYINAVYFNTKIALNGLNSSDTLVSFEATYEITGQ